jgi:branched-chain amino acid transport system substrate-binding protein
MKGMAWESPRGPISIDPETRDIGGTTFRVDRRNGRCGTQPEDELADIKSNNARSRLG